MEIEIKDGQDIIQLLYDEFATCLVIEKALVVNWPDCMGSIGEYYSTSRFHSDVRTKLTQELNELLIDGKGEELLNSVEKFLNLFSNGYYRISFTAIKLSDSNFFHEDQVKYSDVVPQNKRFSGAFYPFKNQSYFFSVPNSKINQSRVEYYVDIIKGGSRPKAIIHDITCSNSDSNYFILDGHHKIRAYRKLGIEIPAIRINKFQEKMTPTAEILKYSSELLEEHEFEYSTQPFLVVDSEGLTFGCSG